MRIACLNPLLGKIYMLYLDTETTGLSKSDTIVEVEIVDDNGVIHLNPTHDGRPIIGLIGPFSI